MIRTRFKKVLLVAPDIFPNQLLADYTNVKHISATGSVFPAIYETTPDVIVFDYEFVGKDLEKILRRIRVNKFYNKIKICCFKNSRDENTDGLLRVLGIDHMIYREDLLKNTRNKSVLNTFSSIIDASIVKWVINASN